MTEEENKVVEAVEETTQQTEETTPVVEDDGVIRVDLRNFKQEEDAVQEQETDASDVPVGESSDQESSEAVVEEIREPSETEEPVQAEEQSVLEEITEEEIIEQVEIAEEAIEKVVNVKEIVEVKTVDEIDNLTDQEKEVYEEEVAAAIVEYVEELETEQLVEVVEQVAQVSVQNLAVADEQTKQVVQAVVNEVTNVETVAELNEEEKQVVAEVLGVTETNDVQIIAEQSAKDENINIAVQEYVDRATQNASVENYSISNVIVEVQVEQFFADPIGQFTDIDLSDIVISDIGSDMPEAVKTQAAKTVVPVIIVGQIIATPITRRF